MRALGIIPARGSSKRLPRKNILSLAGHPLIAYMVRAAGAAMKLDRVIVSTEDDEIAEIARQYGADVPFRRPTELAEDYAQDTDILLHAHDTLAAAEGQGYEILVQLQPTTPFVLPETIDACVEALRHGDANCCFAVRPVSEPPQWMFNVGAEGQAVHLTGEQIKGDAIHTQLLEKAYFPSGAAYAVRTDVLRRERTIYAAPLQAIIMDSRRATDIDEDVDLMVAGAIAAKHGFGLVDAVQRKMP